MTIRRSLSIIFLVSTLTACIGDATTGVDGAVATQAGQGAPPQAGASATAIATVPSVAEVAESEAAPSEREAPPSAGMALADSIGGIRAFVALMNDEAPEPGTLRILEHEGNWLALAKVSVAALDPASRAWLRRPVRVFTSANQSCAGHVAALELASQWIWESELFDLEEDPPSRADIEAAMGDRLSSVVAHVVLDGPKPCRGRPLLIQDAAHPSLRVARTLRNVPRARAVLEAFRNLPRYRALKAECEQHGDCLVGDETGVPSDRPVELTAFRFPNDSKVYVVASMAAAGCAWWGAPLSAIFTLGPSHRAQPTLYRVNEEAALGSPDLMLDVGRDGQLQFVTSRWFRELELVEEQGSSRQLWSTHFVGCGC